MSVAYEMDRNGAAIDGAKENGEMSPTGGGGVASNHGWQKVTNVKKQRRQAARLAAAGGAQQAELIGDSGDKKDGSDSKVFQAQESAAVEKRGRSKRRKAKQETAEDSVGTVSNIRGGEGASNYGRQQNTNTKKQRQEAAKLAAAGDAQQRELVVYNGGRKGGSNLEVFQGFARFLKVDRIRRRARREAKQEMAAAVAAAAGEEVLSHSDNSNSDGEAAAAIDATDLATFLSGISKAAESVTKSLLRKTAGFPVSFTAVATLAITAAGGYGFYLLSPEVNPWRWDKYLLRSLGL